MLNLCGITLGILPCSPARGEARSLGARLTAGLLLMGSGTLLGDLGVVALSGVTTESDSAKAAALMD